MNKEYIKQLMSENNITKEVELLDFKETTGIGCRCFIVLCKFIGKRKYATWILNESTGSLGLGHYIEDYFDEVSDSELYKQAIDNFNNRR